MAKSFLVPINMGGLEITNHRLHMIAGDLGTPNEGDIWMNSTTHIPKINDGSYDVPLFVSVSDTDTIDLTMSTLQALTAAVNFSSISSLENSTGVQLINDEDAPGNNELYGTSGAGVKGWFPQPTGLGAHNILSADHSDAATDTVSRGDMLVGKTVTPEWQALTISTTSTHVLRTDGTDVYWGVIPETSHSDVVQDGDFTSQGIMLRGASTGVYSIATGSSAIVGVQDTLTEDSTYIPTSNAVFDAIATAIVGGVSYKGAYNAATDTPALETTPGPLGIKTGWMYTVTADGDFFGQSLEIGDVLIAENNSPTTLAEWTIVSSETGVDTFLAHADTPSAYTSNAFHLLRVNTTPNAVEFTPYAFPSTVTQYSMLYASAIDTVTTLANTTGTGRYLRGSTGAAPSWSTLQLPNTTTINQLLYSSAASVISALTISTTVGTFLRNTTTGGIPAWSTLVLPNAAARGDLLYATAANTLGNRTIGTVGKLLRSDGTDPQWSTVTMPNTITALSIFAANSANTLVAVTGTAWQSVRVNSGATAWEAYTPLRKKEATCAAATSTIVTHSFNTLDVVVQVYNTTTPWEEVECDIERNTVNQVTVRFAVAPTLAQYSIVIIG